MRVLDVEDDLAVRADCDDLKDILGNLLENAVQHAKGRILVRAALYGSAVHFDVEDDGPGISATKRKSAIDRGKRLDSSAVGAGLGLAIVSDVLDHYGKKLTLSRSKLGGLKASFVLTS